MAVDMRICGSCHILVEPERESSNCPRCGNPLDPDAASRLRVFIEEGIVEFNRKGGVTLRQAQDAADAILAELVHMKVRLARHHVGDVCSICHPEQHAEAVK